MPSGCSSSRKILENTLWENVYKKSSQILFDGVNQLSYQFAVEIYNETKSFPKEEKYSLSDQMRRSSRSVPANISEAWYKRKYPKSFISKLIDSSGEAAETQVWIDFAMDLGYLDQIAHDEIIAQLEEILKMLNSMIQTPEKFCK